METITTDDKIRLKQMQISIENEPQRKQELQKQLQKLQKAFGNDHHFFGSMALGPLWPLQTSYLDLVDHL